MTSKFKIVSKDGCAFCVRSKDLLDRYKIPYEVEDITNSPERFDDLIEMGLRTLPQIWNGDDHIGGYNELCDYLIEEGYIDL